MSLKTVILSGGVGSRLWPLSRKYRPKQYLKIFAEKSLFRLAIERNLSFSSMFLVVGNRDNYQLSNKELKNFRVPYQNIVEALPRNTTAAIAFSALACDEDDVLLVVPSDHIIENMEVYEQSVQRAVELAEERYIVTFGLNPTHPETGYGYIESEGENVISFREKPNRDRAEDFCRSGNFYWNSGMFCFKASVFLEELKKFEPQIYTTVKEAWEKSEDGILHEEDMRKIPSKSVDYAVMERTDKMKVVKGGFDWSDLGSFQALYDYLSRNGNIPDENGNMYIGEGKSTFFLGLRNTILIETEDINLVLRKEMAQEVKGIYEQVEGRE